VTDYPLGFCSYCIHVTSLEALGGEHKTKQKLFVIHRCVAAGTGARKLKAFPMLIAFASSRNFAVALSNSGVLDTTFLLVPGPLVLQRFSSFS
jgi:hypothetical protein